MPAYYEIGPSGRGPCLTCRTDDDLLRLGGMMPPGKYWITRTELHESVDGVKWQESEDWGVLVVRSPEDWHLESLAGMEAGPGYLLA